MTRRFPVSIYIHIPFCRKKCGYCDFYSVSAGHNYYIMVLNGILGQLETFLADNIGAEIHTVYIGGGTPSSLPASVLDSFLAELGEILPDTGQEFTIEVNPEDVSVQLLDTLKMHGINRISMGIQSLNSTLLKVLGRNASKEASLEAMEKISLYWDGRANFDLITSIPGQSPADTLSDLKTVIRYSPDHISLYTLTYECNTPITKRIETGTLSRIPEKTESIIYNKSIDFLEEAGYRRYEVSNFSKTGAQSIHNRAYWTMAPYFGAGPSAVSTIPGSSGPLRLENPGDMHKFTDPVQESINAGSFLLEHLLMGFRLVEGLSVNRINKIFNIDFFEYFSNSCTKWNSRLRVDNGNLSLDRDGLQLLNRFLLDLSDEISEDFNEKCNWPLI